jgi:hypothetical protein
MTAKKMCLLGAAVCFVLSGVFLLDGCTVGPDSTVTIDPGGPGPRIKIGVKIYQLYDTDGDGVADLAVDTVTGQLYRYIGGKWVPVDPPTPPSSQPAEPAPGAGLPAAGAPLGPPVDMQIIGSALENLTARGLLGEAGSTIEANAIDVVSYNPGLVDVLLHWNTSWGLPEGCSYNLAYECAYCPGATPDEPGYAKIRLQGSESEVMSLLAAWGVRSANFSSPSGDQLTLDVQGNAVQVKVNGNDVTNVPIH